MKRQPEADLTPLMEGAAQFHELFMSYVGVGFTREEALRIVLEMMRGAKEQA